MYKIKGIKGKKDLSIIWTDKCEKKLFALLKETKLLHCDFIMLSLLPWKSIYRLSSYFEKFSFDYIIVNDFGAFYFFKKKKKILGRQILASITRNFNNLEYFLERFSGYNISWIFIDYKDYFNISIDLLKYLRKSKIKVWIFLIEGILSYSPRCHYMINKKKKWEFYGECSLYCENISKEHIFILWTNNDAIYDYKSLVIRNNNFSNLKKDKVRFSFFDYLIY
jgi:hypothetical protein